MMERQFIDLMRQVQDLQRELDGFVKPEVPTQAPGGGSSHAAFIGLEDNANTAIDPDTDDRIQITDDGVVNADASGVTLALSIDQSQISHDSISGVSEDDHHAAFIGLEDNAAVAITPAVDNRIQVTDDSVVNADASGNTLALSIDQSQISHDSIGGVSADDHHAQQHDITGADHTASALSVGQVIRATGATTFTWDFLQHADLGPVDPDDHHAQDHASRHITGGADEVDGDQVDIDWTPSNYTPNNSPAEVTSVDHLTSHLKGIDDELATLGGSASPGGADSNVQYNNSGAFGGESNFTWDDTDKLLNVNDSSGGDIEIENTGTGGTSFNDWVGGLSLVAGDLEFETGLYPGIRWQSKDISFTTTNPKTLAAILVNAGETYNADNTGGTDMSFFVSKDTPGTAPTFGTAQFKIIGDGGVQVNQINSASGEPALFIRQDDISEEFIRFQGQAAAATLTQSLVADTDVTTATREVWLKIFVTDDGNQVTDQEYFIPGYRLT